MPTLEHRTSRLTSHGRAYPLGATIIPEGVNFALFSEHATEVFLLLFDLSDAPPTDIIRLEQKNRHIWHILVHGVGAGQLYGYKVRGPYDPSQGHRFNDRKLLVCPYARAVTGKIRNREKLLNGYDASVCGDADLLPDRRDNTLAVPLVKLRWYLSACCLRLSGARSLKSMLLHACCIQRVKLVASMFLAANWLMVLSISP